MNNNQFDNLNYQKAKRTPLYDIIQGYAQRGTSKPNNDPASDSMKVLQEQYRRDPNSLNPTQLLTLGLYELNQKREKNSEEQQKAVNDYMNPHNEAEKERQEMISTQSEEYHQLMKNLKELQDELTKLSSGDSE